MDLDTSMPDYDVAGWSGARHFVVAVDFGTTFSSVSYVGYDQPDQRARTTLQQIETVQKYPSNPYGHFTSYDVPTELWYAERSSKVMSQAINNKPQHRSLLDDIVSDDEDDNEQEDSLRNPPELARVYSDLANSDRPPVSLFWGYEVQEQFKDTDDKSDHLRRLARFKLILDDSAHTANIRNIIEGTCKALKSLRLIENDTDTIADFLEQLFRHTKRQLIASEEYTDKSTVEFVLCIPAVWKSRAARQMHAAMIRAIAKSGFGSLEHGSIDNLFLVSEPEATAAYLLADENTRLSVGDTFVLLDAGGGTVDSITYTVDKTIPLRLKTEELEPGGAMCGSSFINERFEELLIKRLKTEEYLEQDGETLSRIVNELVVEFERSTKDKMDRMIVNQATDFTIHLKGLRENKKLRFKNGKIVFSSKEVRGLFKPSWEGVAHLMMNQLKGAQDKGQRVRTVILTGGFGQSESLAQYLSETLIKEYGSSKEAITLHAPKVPPTAVSSGAVIRALRKEDGPDRVIQSSYGFSRTEPYGSYEAHEKQEKRKDPIDGNYYVEGTIDWVIQKGDAIASELCIERDCEYTFGLRKKKLICAEALYVSDRKQKSHYRHDHPENEEAEVAGFIEADMTFLKDEGRIKVEPPSGNGRIGYWKVCCTLLIFVSGRNLRYEIRWPGRNGATQGVGQTSLAAAFRPGTE